MGGSKDDGRWVADDEWNAVWPTGISGNTINGLGEPKPRSPTQIFWHRDTKGKELGEVQDHVVEKYNSVPALAKVYREADRGPRKLPEKVDQQVQKSPVEWTKAVKGFALNEPGARPEGVPGKGSEAELVGITQVDPLWVYEGYEADLPNVIMLGLVMDHGRLSQLPGDDVQVEGQLETADQYNRGARVANYLAAWIRSQGYNSRAHAGPWVGSLTLVPPAIAAGFGELGDHGSIINRKYGSSFRLAAVETDMPLEFDKPDRFGADEFCERCQICRRECPPKAITKDKKIVRGVEKYYVDFDRCLPYFNKTYGCGICLAVCPWSYPERAEKLAQKWQLKMANPLDEDD